MKNIWEIVVVECSYKEATPQIFFSPKEMNYWDGEIILVVIDKNYEKNPHLMSPSQML